MAVKVISYGVLSDYEQDADGFTYFGAGNTATGWHGKQSWSGPGPIETLLSKIFRFPLRQPELEATVGLKVHYLSLIHI